MPDVARIRPAVRAVVTDPDWRLLLVHFTFGGDKDLPGGLWACPGGGVNPGESASAALRRELVEELGLDIDDPGQPVWRKEHIFAMQRWDGQRDTYYWLEVAPFEPRPAMSEAELRAENVDGMRWWSYDELQAAQHTFDSGATDDPERIVFSPRPLGHLVAQLRTDGRPARLVQLEPL